METSPYYVHRPFYLEKYAAWTGNESPRGKLKIGYWGFRGRVSMTKTLLEY